MQTNPERARMILGSGFDALTELAEAYRNPMNSPSMALMVERPLQPIPAAFGQDRLPLDWYKARSETLKARIQQGGMDVVLLGTSINQIYFTGLFRTGDLRRSWVLLPVAEANAAHWFSPLLDSELIESWWCSSNTTYFCDPHAADGFPNEGRVTPGNRVDLFAWMLGHLKARGFGAAVIGTDMQLTAAELRVAEAVLPGARFVPVAQDCHALRCRKTPEEIALTQRVYRYFDTLHAFARDYVLTRGTQATDFEIGQVMRAFGINLLLQDVARDGRPHSAVGIDVSANYVRCGPATAYPHPNQFFCNAVQRGQPLYINSDMYLGGYGGECYRNYQIQPVAPHQEKMWQVVADCAEIMVEGCRPGRACSDVAQDVHKYQIANGMQNYIYHRPGHGVGHNYEGHQAPCLSLGDETVIEAGMMFSVEPGLYDVERGIGVNPSDTVLVTEFGGVLMSRVPFSKEWSFLTL
ncbi:MAG: Xaa-Pro peptidase family protein [Cypionkella sp.]